jgi:hypothetical protein
MNRLNFPGLCCYIPEGANTGTAEDVAFYAYWVTRPDDDTGSTSTSYGAEESTSAQNQELTQDIGPTPGIYDPEWAAWLAGEIV